MRPDAPPEVAEEPCVGLGQGGVGLLCDFEQMRQGQAVTVLLDVLLGQTHQVGQVVGTGGGIGADGCPQLRDLLCQLVLLLGLEGLVGARVEVVHEDVADVVGDLWQLRQLVLKGRMQLGAPQQDVVGDCEGTGEGHSAGGAPIGAVFSQHVLCLFPGWKR